MVLITGGTGFLGSYIIRELVERGYQVRAIKRNTSRLPFYISENILQMVDWVEADVMDVFSLDEAMDGVDAVIHAAAVVSFKPGDTETLQKINVEGTAN